MEELEKSVRINELFVLYGSLLAQSQYKMIELYYALDLSLSEIAAQEGISRNGVYDAIKKGVSSLNEYEEKLHLLAKKKKIESKLEQIKNELSDDKYQKIIKILKEE